MVLLEEIIAAKTSEETNKFPNIDLPEFLDEVEKRAYEFYLDRYANGTPGSDMSDWLKAEKEIKAKHKIK